MRTLTPMNNVFDRMVTLSRAMDDALGLANGSEATLSWIPALDTAETEHGYEVSIDLPGVKPEAVDVLFDRNTLTVRGTREVPSEKDTTRVYIRERVHGAFERQLRFPQHVEGDKIAANFSSGVLTIQVPKAESAKPRKIAVKA